MYHGRDFVTPEDMRVLIRPVYAHRMRTRGGDSAADAIFNEILDAAALPT